MSAEICVIGVGYVGLTAAACFASLGHQVRCADSDTAKLRRLRKSEVELLEADLPELVARGQAAGNLDFCIEAPAFLSAVRESKFVVLCLPTPMGADGAADLSAIRAVCAEIRTVLSSDAIVVVKSTVPVGGAAEMRAILGRPDIAVVSNPEFLREGHAVHDFLRPDRIIVGAESTAAATAVACLYEALDVPVVITGNESAELIKYAANSFLAIKVSWANSLAELSETWGADIADVAHGVGLDHRIGRPFLDPGPGWGGPCLPKDTAALLRSASVAGVDLPLLRAAVGSNSAQHRKIVAKVRKAIGVQLAGTALAVFGVTFKANTGDIRDSPALAVIDLLYAAGARITAFDPGIGSGELLDGHGATFVRDPYMAVHDAHAVLVLTEWQSFKALNWQRISESLSGRTVVDTRNILDPDAIGAAGLDYHGLGKSSSALVRMG